MYWDVTSVTVFEGSGDPLLKLHRDLKSTEVAIVAQAVDVTLVRGQ